MFNFNQDHMKDHIKLSLYVVMNRLGIQGFQCLDSLRCLDMIKDKDIDIYTKSKDWKNAFEERWQFSYEREANNKLDNLSPDELKQLKSLREKAIDLGTGLAIAIDQYIDKFPTNES